MVRKRKIAIKEMPTPEQVWEIASKAVSLAYNYAELHKRQFGKRKSTRNVETLADLQSLAFVAKDFNEEITKFNEGQGERIKRRELVQTANKLTAVYKLLKKIGRAATTSTKGTKRNSRSENKKGYPEIRYSIDQLNNIFKFNMAPLYESLGLPVEVDQYFTEDDQLIDQEYQFKGDLKIFDLNEMELESLRKEGPREFAYIKIGQLLNLSPSRVKQLCSESQNGKQDIFVITPANQRSYSASCDRLMDEISKSELFVDVQMHILGLSEEETRRAGEAVGIEIGF